MKKTIVFLFVVLSCFSYVLGQGQRTSDQGNPQEQEQPFRPLFADVNNSVAAQKAILSNTYRFEDFQGYNPDGTPKGGFWTAFRIHKNWFLTCAHGPFISDKFPKEKVTSIPVSVKEYDSIGSVPPFALVFDMTKIGQGKARVYKYKPDLELTYMNTNRGYDLALVYVPDSDPSQAGSKGANKDLKKVKAQLNAMKGKVPGNIIAQMEREISKAEKKSTSAWQKFINYPIKPFQLFILSEKTIISELGYPKSKEVPYSFTLTAFHIHPVELHGGGFTKFNFVPIGTHKGTNAIFYQRVSNLIPGTSGSPIAYGKYVVSVDSATNCSPMLTEDVHDWLKDSMGSDYTPGMCITPTVEEGGGGVEVPLVVEGDASWNDGRTEDEINGHAHHP